MCKGWGCYNPGLVVAIRPRRRLPALIRRRLTACSCRQRIPRYEGVLFHSRRHGSRLGVSPAPHLAFCIFMSSKGFFFLFCAQLAHLFCGGVVLGRVGTHRWWSPSHTLATPTASW